MRFLFALACILALTGLPRLAAASVALEPGMDVCCAATGCQDHHEDRGSSCPDDCALRACCSPAPSLPPAPGVSLVPVERQEQFAPAVAASLPEGPRPGVFRPPRG